MKNRFNQKIVKILLLILFCCPAVFTQLSYIKYKGNIHEVATIFVSFIVKEGYYNDELLGKLATPPYIVALKSEPYRMVLLQIKDYSNIADINILDHYLKFEKEEYVETITPHLVGNLCIPWNEFNISGQIYQNGKPLVNHIVNLFNVRGAGSCYNAITDENGNYIFKEVGNYYSSPSEMYDYAEVTLSAKIGDSTYSTIFLLDDHKIINFNSGTITGINEPEEIPVEYTLSQNYPNPFNPTTVIKYQIPEAAQVSLKVYDVMGKEVATLVNSYQARGSYDVTFNANGLSSGIYFYKLNANGVQLINKMLLMK